MKTATLLLIVAVALTAACDSGRPVPVASAQQVHTIENTPLRMTTIEVPPTVREQQVASTQEKTNDPFGRRDPKPETTSTNLDELNQQMDLPFAPAIAMDPVDGGKVSVRANTPVVEYKKKLYYFTSEQNRRAFMAAPEQYLKGNLAKY